MFIDSSIPQNFNKVAEMNSNYVILVKEDILSSNRDYEAYIQFFNPSTTIEHINDYRIHEFDSVNYDYHYLNNQYYTYIDYVDAIYSKHTYEITHEFNLWQRYDISSIGVIVSLLLALVIIIVNLATSLVHRGGIFHA